MKKVQFRFFNEALKIKTEKAQLIMLGNVANPIKVWLPLSQINLEKSNEDEGYSLITMPEWLFAKNSILGEFTDPYYI